jgi:uncharacterized membrane protein HdeD (DUF308 family)
MARTMQQSEFVKDASELTKRMSVGIGIRGVVAVIFGVLLLAFPDIGLGALVLTFGAFAFIDGVATIVAASSAPKHSGRGWLYFEGVVSMLTGIVVWVWPDISALALVYVIGAWAIVIGGMEIAAAFGLTDETGDRWMLGLGGLLSIAFGVIMWVQPGAGALAVLALIAAFAIVTGIMQIVAAFRMRKERHELDASFETKVPAHAA